MKVLLVGGAGYIGSHVALEFIKRGDEVDVFDNFSTGLRTNVYKECKVYEGDILNPCDLDKALESKNYDVVIHLAAFKAAGESMIDPSKYATNNITGSLNIIKACIKAGVQNFILSSTAAVFGEPEYLPVDEKHPTNPENYYGYTKLAIEENLKWFSFLKPFNYVALRYFNAAGYDMENKMTGLEKNPANLIPVVMEAACNMRDKVCIFGDDYNTIDGTGVRDYVHVSDLAQAHVLASDFLLKNKENLIVNLGSELGLSVKQIIDESKKVSQNDFKVEITSRRKGDPAKLVASSKLAREKLNWNPKYSNLEDIIKSTWNVYKKYKK